MKLGRTFCRSLTVNVEIKEEKRDLTADVSVSLVEIKHYAL